MGALRQLLAIAALATVAPAHVQGVGGWRPYIDEASRRFGIPSAWIEAVMQAESRGRTTLDGRPIRSLTGAIGLMQVMPETWADMRVRLGLGGNPDDPRDNILAGTFFLRLMYDRFGYPGLFAAYNAGPRRYAEHLAGRRKLPAETVGYLAAVSPWSSPQVVATALPAPPASIFAVRRDVRPINAEHQSPAASSLFVTLSKAD